MLTGRQPFTGETPIQVAFQHVNNDVPAPSELVDWLPIEIDDAVRALAARDPDDRPVDAARRPRAAAPHPRRPRRRDARTPRRRRPVDRAARRRPTRPRPTWTRTTTSRTTTTRSSTTSRRRADDDETTLIETGDARGTTVALPIGLGVGVEVLTAPPADPPRRAPPRPLDRPARPARRAHRRRRLVVPAARARAPTRRSRRSSARTRRRRPRSSSDAGLGADPSSAFDGEAPIGEVFATDPGQGEPHPQGRHRRVHGLQGPRLRRVPRRRRRRASRPTPRPRSSPPA